MEGIMGANHVMEVSIVDMGKLLMGAQYEVGEHANKRAVIPH